MKAILIKGLTLPEKPEHLMDLRIYGDGTVQMVGCMGSAGTVGKAIEIEYNEEEQA